MVYIMHTLQIQAIQRMVESIYINMKKKIFICAI